MNLFGGNITDLAHELANKIEGIADIDEKIDQLNEVRSILHKVSPLKHHPADNVQWIKSEEIEGNDYNPNYVAPPEMKLLIRSIIEDGYTMPIVTYQEDIRRIVDGFHRRKANITSKQINDSTYGRLPTTIVRSDHQDRSNRMASTIRHNRARGSHNIDLMVEIVRELKGIGQSDAWIMKHIGMDADELLRLKQLSGLAELFKDREFSNSWEPA